MSKKNKKGKIGWRIVRVTLMALGLFLLMLVTFGYFIGRRHFVVHEQTFYFADLPDDFDGYRILQFADLHAGGYHYPCKDDVETIVSLINSQKCDVVFFVGDAVCRNSTELDQYKGALCKIKAHDGVYSVMGNHDYGTYNKFKTEKERLADVDSLHKKQSDLGWKLLLNEHAMIQKGKSKIAVVGVENDGLPPFPALGDIPKAAKGLKKSDFCILLTHDPTSWKRKVVGKTSFQLTLSGHTHGGQFKMFGWSPSSYRYKEWSGTHVEGGQILNITDGVGCSRSIPFRFGAWPEVNVITLKKLRGK